MTAKSDTATAPDEDAIERVWVESPAGPIEVHPQLVELYPDDFKPLSKTAAAKAAADDSKE